jgi:hypothetical protein
MATMTATYSPEDNKLRLYSDARLGAETYARVKAAGFKWAPKQNLFVAPTWSPAREDLLLELCGEVGDEDYSPQERSADRAERFTDYRDKRAAEAGASADAFDAGPSAFGHQNRTRAERQAARHDRYRGFAVSQWSKAEYWQQRTQGVISHALYKSSAPVRRSRILRLEAEQRKHEKSRKKHAARFTGWSKVPTLEGADVTRVPDEAAPSPVLPAYRLAYALANSSCDWFYKHPRTGKDSSLYSHLTNDDPITPREAAALWLDNASDPADPDSYSARWSAHYELRLGYERTMLAEEGGSAAEAEMEPGGFIKAGTRTGSVFTDVPGGWMQIHSVNRSPATKRVTSVKVMGTVGYRDARPGLVSINIERLPEGSYRAPTDEERQQFKTATAERKAAEKAGKPKEPPLINPTDEDAERLQARWNATAKEKHDKAVAERRTYGDFNPSEVYRMTQAEYSQRSKGSYSLCETRTLHACGRPARRSSNLHSVEGKAYDDSLGEAIAKLRLRSGSDWYSAPRVIILTDKPQKPLPLTAPAATLEVLS